MPYGTQNDIRLVTNSTYWNGMNIDFMTGENNFDLVYFQKRMVELTSDPGARANLTNYVSKQFASGLTENSISLLFIMLLEWRDVFFWERINYVDKVFTIDRITYEAIRKENNDIEKAKM